MKSGAHFEQAAYATMNFSKSRGWSRNARQQFQQCGFPRTVSTDKAHHFSLIHIQGDIAQRPQVVNPAGSTGSPERSAQSVRNYVAQGEVTLTFAYPIALTQPFNVNDRLSHRLDYIRHRRLHFLKIGNSAQKNEGGHDRGHDE